MLALRNDAALLRLHEVGAVEAAGRVLGRSVEDLGLRADRGRVRRALLKRHAVRLALREEAAALVAGAAPAHSTRGRHTKKA